MSIGTAPIGQGVNGAVRQVDAVNLAVERVVVGIGASICADQHALAVGREGRRALMIEIASGQLSSGAAVRRHDENLAEGARQIALAIGAENHPVDQLWRIRPLGVFGRLRQFYFQGLAFLRHGHGEGQPLAVRRPCKAAG